MSINPEALQKLLMEMDNQLNKSKAELGMCNLQLSRVETNLRLINYTTSSLTKLCDVEDNETVYKGIGKTFVAKPVKSYLNDIKVDEKDFNETKKSLLIKKDYLQTTLDNTLEHMTQLVKR